MTELDDAGPVLHIHVPLALRAASARGSAAELATGALGAALFAAGGGRLAQFLSLVLARAVARFWGGRQLLEGVLCLHWRQVWHRCFFDLWLCFSVACKG